MKKKKTSAQLKKELDTLFSRWVRLSSADSDGFCSCYTCGARKHWKEIQNGHFISRQYLATRFDIDNCRQQCLAEESTVQLADGRTKSVAEVAVGDTIRAFDDTTFTKKDAVVESVSSFVPDELYEVELENGKKFHATGDHRVVSNGNWVTIENMLHTRSVCDIMEF